MATASIVPPVINVAAREKLVDVDNVAQRLLMSKRHVFRMEEDGLMPKAIRIGRLVRWRAADIDSWIAAGCPASNEPTNPNH
jgi:excisionase family DNA binding protein